MIARTIQAETRFDLTVVADRATVVRRPAEFGPG